MAKFGMGQGIPRTEDPRLLRGGGRYVSDIVLPREAAGHALRSPHAHARIRGIDTAAAAAAPGVIAVLTGADYAADGLGDMPVAIMRNRKDGTPMYVPPMPALVKDHVKLVGDMVAFVVAETAAQAKDAAELIEVDYEPLPAVADTAAAIKPGAPAVWPANPDNVSFYFEIGNRAGVEAAFKAAHHVTTLDLVITRVAVNPMEPRSALADYDAWTGRYTLYAGVQGPHAMRAMAAAIFKLPEDNFRIVSPDMGGGFGMRSSPYREYVLCLWASRRTGRPVKWVSERSEAFVSDDQARDNVTTIALALDKDGKFLGLRVETVAAIGAYMANLGAHSPTNNLGSLSGVYTTPAVLAQVTAVWTNTPSTAPYRGAGRPEATYVLERVIDKAAREMKIDRFELRRRNLIPASAMPYKTGFVFTYDSGDFAKNMDDALRLADVAGFAQRKEDSRRRGRLRGLGFANAIEQSAGAFEETAEIRIDASGFLTLHMGTHSHGQGHDTAFRQILCDLLGVEFENIRLVQGDTDQAIHGRGTFGSRSSGAGGAAMKRAAERIIEKCRKIAAHRLEAAVDDIAFKDGVFAVVGTDRRMTIKEAAAAAYSPMMLPKDVEAGLSEYAVWVPPAPTFPNGSHVSEVEIDPETGTLHLDRYIVVDDVGTIVNPLLLKGQLHGGIVQGVGQILMETMVYDSDSAQVLSGSFMDYTMPRADDLPFFEIGSNIVPSPTNPLGIKGAGEAGCVGAMPCVMSAVVDALADAGVAHFDMPASPARIWAAIRAARGARAA
ncbi:MAG: xanthine dehydrogenase family protein molybdopterin-binding subunit [Alphaproteobacteria bacterium]|nr:xanthine dehydrogenase family protein molybdopterin-binding subunit [Alphaproteobacteria bacterium]